MIYSLLILSVLIGCLIVFFLKPKPASVRLLLAFSGAYLLSVTVLHLLPEVYHNHNHNSAYDHSKRIGVLILIGILTQSVLESFSKGVEHGHIHLHSKNNRFPYMLFISLCIHAFSEGLPIHSVNTSLLWAIGVHKIPVAVVLTTFLLHANYARLTVFMFLTVFALMSPLGYIVGREVPFLIEHHSEITALIIGIFLHISTVILFEGSENHTFNLSKFIAILLGILLTVFTV